MLTLFGEIEGICSVRHEGRFYLGDRSKIIGAGAIDRGRWLFSKKKNKWGENFLTTKFESQRFHFSKKAIFEDQKVLLKSMFIGVWYTQQIHWVVCMTSGKAGEEFFFEKD